VLINNIYLYIIKNNLKLFYIFYYMKELNNQCELSKSCQLIKNIIDNSYDKNFNPFYFKHYSNIFDFNYSFYEWYFIMFRYNKINRL
jgi:hypothetical protein